MSRIIVPNLGFALLALARSTAKDPSEEVALCSLDCTEEMTPIDLVTLPSVEISADIRRVQESRPYQVSRLELKRCVSGLTPATASQVQHMNGRPFRSKRG